MFAADGGISISPAGMQRFHFTVLIAQLARGMAKAVSAYVKLIVAAIACTAEVHKFAFRFSKVDPPDDEVTDHL